MRRTLDTAAAARTPTPGAAGPAAGLGPPPARAGQGHLPGRPRPHRPGPGRAAGRHRRCRRRRRRSRSSARRPPNAQAPGGVEVTEPTVDRAHRAGRHPAGRALAADPRRRPADAARPRRRSPGGTRRQRAKWELAAASLRGFRDDPRRAGLHRGPLPQARRVGDRERRQRLRGRLLRPAGVPRPEPAVLQAELVGVFERVYEVGPVFRAEPHDTVRHLAEYVSLDVELGFIEDHRDVIARACATWSPGWSTAIHEHAGARRRAARRRRAGGARGAPDAALPRRARDRRRARGRARPRPGARARARRVGAGASTAATSWSSRATRPRSRAFYSHPDPDDPHWSPVVRPDLPRHRAGQRRAAAAPVRRLRRARSSARGYPYAPYASYVEAFRRGIPPHGGFAIGLERWVGRLVEAANIREVTLFPRDLHRLAP